MRAILMYHSIDSSGSPVSLAADVFVEHARFLASGRVRVVPLADLAAGPPDEDAVALTFDDGFMNFATDALPVLRDHGLAATVFVVTDHVGQTNAWGGRDSPGIPTLPLMTWGDLGSALSSGVEIGAHSRRHPDLTTLTNGQLEDETAGGVAIIGAELGIRPTSFAYPYGAVNDVVARVAGDVFMRSVTTELRAMAGNEDPTRWPRLDAWYFRNPGQLARWGTPAFRRRLWLRAQGRRVRRLVAGGPGGRA